MIVDFKTKNFSNPRHITNSILELRWGWFWFFL